MKRLFSLLEKLKAGRKFKFEECRVKRKFMKEKGNMKPKKPLAV